MLEKQLHVVYLRCIKSAIVAPPAVLEQNELIFIRASISVLLEQIFSVWLISDRYLIVISGQERPSLN